MSRDRLFGRETKEMPESDRLRAEAAHRSEMFGRGKVPVAEKEPDRRALLGKVEREAPVADDRPAGRDLFGRRGSQARNDRPARGNGDRDR